ncbi:hypothetical protein Cob_v010551 [Colletotrichum orbiculare MAFF 240422]|uniref:Uncharacterized protein n=1 Tax=Colletotrichum orbiculare (strain 104-T / ATCC 96160 / CBS 514.97 / LARS 414 / MAFF 240422) TaxID=1213857 RepID=A0A484FFC3_COLOR|nr:hypothetical protein Cob_v010551 [Colletotrichum orbiculare MAFF 240422]
MTVVVVVAAAAVAIAIAIATRPAPYFALVHFRRRNELTSVKSSFFEQDESQNMCLSRSLPHDDDEATDPGSFDGLLSTELDMGWPGKLLALYVPQNSFSISERGVGYESSLNVSGFIYVDAAGGVRWTKTHLINILHALSVHEPPMSR